MAEEFGILDELVDVQEMEKQAVAVEKMLERINDAAVETAKNIKLFSDKVDFKIGGTKETLDGIKNLSLTTANYQKILAAVGPEVDKLTKSQRENLQGINELYKAEQTARSGANETVKLIKTEIDLTAKQEAGRSQLAKTIALNKAQLQSENLERTRLAKVLIAENNSKEKAQAIIDLLINKGKKLNLETEQGRRVNEAYNKTIEKQNAFILANADVETKRIKNVGNYAGSAKIIVDALEKEKKKLEELEKTKIRVQNAGSNFKPSGASPAQRNVVTGFAGSGPIAAIGTNADNSTKEVAELNAEIAKSRTIVEGFSRVTSNPKFLNISSKAGDAVTELRFFTKELVNLERQGLGNSKAAEDLRKHLAQLTDEIGDTRAEIKAMSSDSRGFDLFAGSVTFAADAFQTLAGAAVLAGASEEDAAEATRTLVAIQSVANGVKGIAVELTTKGTAANKAYALVQGLVATTTDASAAATVRMAAAAKLLLGGAIIGGLAYLIVKFTELKKATTEAAKQAQLLAEINAEVAKSAGAEIASLEALYKVATNTTLSLKERKEAVDELQEQYPEYFKNIKDELILQGKAADAYDKTKIAILEVAKTRAIEGKLSELSTKELEKNYEKEVVIKKKRENDAAKAKADRKDNRSAEDRGLDQFTAISQGTALTKDLDDINKGLADISKEKEFLLNQITTVGTKKPPPPPGGSADASKNVDKRLQAEIDAEKRKNDALRQMAINAANEKIRLAQQVVDNENASFQDQLKAIQEIDEQKKLIASIEYADQIANQKKVEDGKIAIVRKSEEEKALAKQQYDIKTAQANEETLKANNDAQKRKSDQALKQLEEENDKALDLVNENQQKIRDVSEDGYNEDIESLNKKFELGLISEEDYNSARAKLEQDYRIESIKNEIDYQNKLIALSGLSAKAKAKALRELSKLEKELSDESLKNNKDNDKQALLSKEQLTQLETLAQQTFFQIADQLSDKYYEKRFANLEKERAENDKNYNKEIENVQKSTISQQEKDIVITQLQAKQDQKKAESAEKERQLKVKQARLDKAITVTKIIVETALAVVHQLGSGDPYTAYGRAILAGAAGAAQLAVALAAPINEYGEGTDNHLGGDAIIGEKKVNGKYQKELLITPDGKKQLVEKPTYFKDLKKGSKVLTESQMLQDIERSIMRDTSRSLSAGNIQPDVPRYTTEDIVNAVNQSTYELSQAFKKQKGASVNVYINGGWDNYIKNTVTN